MDNIIETRNLKKSFGTVQALKGISFSVRRGELFALLGVNGAGKSTTINILVGVLKKDDGELFVDGKDIQEIDKILPEIGIVFQSSLLDRKLTVRDNLFYRAMLYGMDRKTYERRLAFFKESLDLEPLLPKTLGKLSGGQKRWVDIVRALLHEPKILILDEPTTGLDPQTRKAVWNLIELLRKKEGLTVLLTTHYMEEASRADDVVILDKGEIVTRGTPLSLKETYAHDYLRLYRYKESLLSALEGSGLNYVKTDKALEIRFVHTKEAKAFLVLHQDEIDDLEIVKGTMDDVFLNVTGKDLRDQ